MHRHTENIVLLGMGISLAAIGAAFPIMSGNWFRNGIPAVLAVLLIMKGGSKLRCSNSDVILGAATLAAAVLSKIVPARIVPPEIFQGTAVVLAAIFVMTGLTLRAITLDRKERARGGGGA